MRGRLIHSLLENWFCKDAVRVKPRPDFSIIVGGRVLNICVGRKPDFKYLILKHTPVHLREYSLHSIFFYRSPFYSSWPVLFAFKLSDLQGIPKIKKPSTVPARKASTDPERRLSRASFYLRKEIVNESRVATNLNFRQYEEN